VSTPAGETLNHLDQQERNTKETNSETKDKVQRGERHLKLDEERWKTSILKRKTACSKG